MEDEFWRILKIAFGGFPWFVLPMFVTLIWALAKLYKHMKQLVFGDSIVKGGYSDDRRAKEDEAIAKRLAFYTKESARLQIESAKYKAMIEPEIQCEGCGYFHNLRRCPKCTRTAKNQTSKIYISPNDSRQEWISGGSANVSHTISNVRERTLVDVSSEAIRALRAHAFLDLTPHKSQGK